MNALRKPHGVRTGAVEENELSLLQPSRTSILFDPGLAVTLHQREKGIVADMAELSLRAHHRMALDHDFGEVEAAFRVLNDPAIEPFAVGARRIDIQGHKYLANGIAPEVQLL